MLIGTVVFGAGLESISRPATLAFARLATPLSPTHLAEIALAVICCCSALTPVARASALRRSALTVRAETSIRPLLVGGSRLLLTALPSDSTAGRGLIASGPSAARPKAEPGFL